MGRGAGWIHHRLPTASPHQRLLAACLTGGPGAVASHCSAAWLWQFDGFKELRKPQISVPHARGVVIRDVDVFRRREMPPEGWCLRGGVPVTTPRRTLLDLEAIVKESTLEIALDSAARGNPEFFLEMTEFLAPVPTKGRPNGGRLDALVALRFGGEATGSAFETRLLRIIRSAKIEEPTLQHPVFKEPDHPFVHIDFAWVKRKIALFADGESYRLAKRRARFDVAQRLDLTRLGWRVVVVYPKMLDDSKWIASFAALF